jgi:alkylation response protein AidB-like acyl-CoA dehydrogenase
MANFYLDNADLKFHIDKNLDWQELFNWLSPDEKNAVSCSTFEEYISSWKEVLEAFGEIAGEEIAPHAQKVEQEKLLLKDGKVEFPPQLSHNLKVLKEFGVGGFSVSPEYGGMGALFVFDMIGAEMLNRACPSTTLNASWYGPIAHILELYADTSLKATYLPRIATGEWSGNMALTEPDAGSDLSALRAYSEKQEDGSYKIYGTKRFITNGNSEISLVLAKSQKGAQGLEHLSLYLVPRDIGGKPNITIAKLEDKTGLKASATCELVYDGALGFLLGEENKGYKYMLNLMNDSRIGVGFQGIGLMEATFRLAKGYAQERKTWGKEIYKHELICEKLLDLEVELAATRSLGIKAAYHKSLLYLVERYLKSNPKDPIKKQAAEKIYNESMKLVRNLTPLIKYWVGEKSIEHARNTIQVYGGYGYTKEYQPEWWLRESLIYALYEGTSQIQALMCVKDTIKDLIKNPKEFVSSLFAHTYNGFFQKDAAGRKLESLKRQFSQSVLVIVLKLLKANLNHNLNLSVTSPKDVLKILKIAKSDLLKFDDFRPALLHAERLTELKCYVELCQACYLDFAKDNERLWILERMLYKGSLKAHYLKKAMEDEDAVIHEMLDRFSGNAEANKLYKGQVGVTVVQ